jgi:hypothetical protein
MERMTAALVDAPAPSFSYCLPEFIDKDGNRLDTKSKKNQLPRVKFPPTPCSRSTANATLSCSVVY